MQYGASAEDRLVELGRAMVAAGLNGPVPKLTALLTGYMNDAGTSWPQQQQALLSFAKTGMLRAIEGPNEVNNEAAGEGSHGPDDTKNRTKDYPANFLAWARAVDQFRKRNAAALPGVTVVAPSIASGLAADYAALPNVSEFVDAGNMHFYAGGGRQPSYSLPANPVIGYFDNILRWARSAQAPGKPVWLTETGATTSGNYHRSGVSQAKYVANQLFDYFAAGGERLFYYQLIDGSGAPGDIEGNFGLFRHDETPKPAALVLGALKDLLSIGRYDDPKNLGDTEAFAPAYDARGLAVSGLTNPGHSGPGYLVLHKSDGSTMIALWNEPVIDDGNGREVVPADDLVTVDFGSVQHFAVHDPLAPPTQGAPRTDVARMAPVTLRGYPMLVELMPPSRSR